jgi:hypothetical protein
MPAGKYDILMANASYCSVLEADICLSLVDFYSAFELAV